MIYDFRFWEEVGRFTLKYLKELKENTKAEYNQEIWEEHVKYAILFMRSDYQQDYSSFKKFVRNISDTKKDQIKAMNVFNHFLRVTK